MDANETKARTNRELLKVLKGPIARFYPMDLHVHSLGSYDVLQSGRFETLPASLQTLLNSCPSKEPVEGESDGVFPLGKEPDDPCRFDQNMATSGLLEAFLDELLQRRDGIELEETTDETDNWAILGITDHNTAHFSCALADLAWDRRLSNHLIVLPGIELGVSFPLEGVHDPCCVHVLCLYAPKTTSSDIRLSIDRALPRGRNSWNFGTEVSIDDLPTFIQCLRSDDSFPAICIAAHVWSKKGMEDEPKKRILASLEASIARTEGELERAKDDGSRVDEEELTQRLKTLLSQESDDEGLHVNILKLIGQCGFDALQVRDRSHEKHYRRLHRFRDNHGRSVPIVCSDAHSPVQAFSCESGIPYAKISIASLIKEQPTTVFDEIRNKVLRFGETRTTYSTPSKVTHWIEGIEILPDAQDAREFWQTGLGSGTGSSSDRSFILPLSRNLNCFVGGRGSGKSAAIEAIAFLADGRQFAEEGAKGERNREDWYRRAEATIRGCRLRLIWKSTAKFGIGALPKRALVMSRYFDPNGQHVGPEIRDGEDDAIVDDRIEIPPIRLLRAHEIERAADSDNLRRLFDALCGQQIDELNESVKTLRQSLARQREEIVSVCESLSKLVRDAGPLRQYGIRKTQFELVDKPELRERYQQVDLAAKVSETSSQTSEAWANLSLADSLSNLEEKATGFFKDEGKRVEDDSGKGLPGHESLHQLIATSAIPENPGHRERILCGIQGVQAEIDGFDQALANVNERYAKQLADRKGDLLKEGLPTGSSEREAKKSAFDAAKTDYEKYQVELGKFEELLSARQSIHQELVETCRQRTDLRKQKAEELTHKLDQDLDSTVLCIMVDAQPLADRKELVAWLEDHVAHVFGKYKPQRCKALVDSGLMPQDFREILLSDGQPTSDRLRVQRERADGGRVDESDSQKILDSCRGLIRVQLSESDTWEEVFRDAIPDDIRNGLVDFPRSHTGSGFAIDHVLELDEIVLDDLPEVCLNDRPDDPRSELRPLGELSPGQRCSAILPILLLSGDYPLMIDQPEENLDNRLIRQVIVNILASMKLRRQVIIATHNPNLPVLGDVEQCVVLEASGRDESTVIARGNLDSPIVARYITDIMEGGREAFQYRQSVYQSHWSGTVDGPQ